MRFKAPKKMYECSFCGKADKKTFKEAREGRLVVICESCQKERR